MVKKKSNASEWKEVFREAAEIASEVPESMQDAAFNRALDLLLGKPEQEGDPTPSLEIKRRKPLNEPNPQPIKAIMESIDRTKHPEITSELTVLDRSLFLLFAVKKDLGIDGMTPPQVAQVLTDKFRIASSRTSISDVLSNAGALVDRKKSGRGYIYRIMAPGEEYVMNPPKARDPKASPRSSKKKDQAGTRKAETKPKKKSTSSPIKGRPGPKAILEKLLQEGFFDKPKRISEIKSHLSVSTGYSYSSEELSPSLLRLIREKMMTRAKGDKNQYDYSKS